MSLSDIGLIGLAVMGENLALNIESRGFSVSVHNRSTEKIHAFINGRAANKKFVGCDTLKSFVESIAVPRRIIVMVKAGKPVDDLLDGLLPLLDKGDIVVDGGNSYWPDTDRRVARCAEMGIHFVGSGVSGGEEGALKGPAIMPGGSREAWQHLEPVLTAAAAKAPDGAPCCAWIGSGGSGHFVKMVHNGIEYGDMQIICEAYDILKNILGKSNSEIADIFSSWNNGKLSSYLVEITADIFTHKEDDGRDTVDVILDAAGQKGTGKWTSQIALDLGIPLTLITEAVAARSLSSMLGERHTAAQLYGKNLNPSSISMTTDDVMNAVFSAKIVSYAQGFALLREASAENGWDLDLATIAKIWRAGCIIRSSFLDSIATAYTADPMLPNLLVDQFFIAHMQESVDGWRKTAAAAQLAGVAVPAVATALAYFDGYTSRRLPANLLQAQRDYFGAHTYERVDLSRGQYFHTNWTGRGGDTVSGTYNA